MLENPHPALLCILSPPQEDLHHVVIRPGKSLSAEQTKVYIHTWVPDLAFLMLL
jgi:hypothetical protein